MGSLTVHVLDTRQKPVRRKKVYCNFVGSQFGLIDTHSEEYTDEDGVAEFDDVPVGKVEVIVNGEKQLSISIGQNDHEDVTVTI
jgi:hypothetical protein